MALNQKKLEGKLLRVLDTPQSTFLKAAQGWSHAYTEYAKDATSCHGLGPLPPAVLAAEKLLTAGLTAAFRTSNNPGAWCRQVAQALSIFWTLPPMTFAGPTIGVVTTPQPALQGVFAVNLTPVLLRNFVRVTSNRPVTTKEAAREIAQALHTTTTTAIAVVHPVPSACGGLIT